MPLPDPALHLAACLSAGVLVLKLDHHSGGSCGDHPCVWVLRCAWGAWEESSGPLLRGVRTPYPWRVHRKKGAGEPLGEAGVERKPGRQVEARVRGVGPESRWQRRVRRLREGQPREAEDQAREWVLFLWSQRLQGDWRGDRRASGWKKSQDA